MVDMAPGPAEPGSRPAGPNTAKLGYVDESDLDLILVLDAHRRGPLIDLLLRATGLSTPPELSATRSAPRNNGTRETDVEVCWDGGVLFIEDKINSGFTPRQPQSYGEEVAARLAAGDAAAAVLVCPQRALERYRAGGGNAFTYISCEELAERAEQAGDSQSLAAAIVLRAAAELPPRPVTDPLAAVWGEGYQAAVAAVAPPGERITFTRTAFRRLDSEWVKLLMAGMPPGADGPWHWLPRGLVAVYLTEQPAPDVLPLGAVVSPSGKSWRVDLPASPVTVDLPAAEQISAISEAVTAAVLIRHWCLEHLGSGR